MLNCGERTFLGASIAMGVKGLTIVKYVTGVKSSETTTTGMSIGPPMKFGVCGAVSKFLCVKDVHVR